MLFYHIDRRLVRSVARIEFFMQCELWDGRQWATYLDAARVRHEGVPVDRPGAAALLQETRRLAGMAELSDQEARQVLDAPGRVTVSRPPPSQAVTPRSAQAVLYFSPQI
jgi:hypothetical protein